LRWAKVSSQHKLGYYQNYYFLSPSKGYVLNHPKE
jgi:hypothetical protein